MFARNTVTGYYFNGLNFAAACCKDARPLLTREERHILKYCWNNSELVVECQCSHCRAVRAFFARPVVDTNPEPEAWGADEPLPDIDY